VHFPKTAAIIPLQKTTTCPPPLCLNKAFFHFAIYQKESSSKKFIHLLSSQHPGIHPPRFNREVALPQYKKSVPSDSRSSSSNDQLKVSISVYDFHNLIIFDFAQTQTSSELSFLKIVFSTSGRLSILLFLPRPTIKLINKL
jgi:hypothetical protein